MKNNYFKPTNYNITFVPDLKKSSYKAKEIITFQAGQGEKFYSLDCVELKIMSCKILKDKNAAAVKFNTKENRLNLYFPKPLSSGEYKLEIEFTGTINNYLAGWYKSNYEINSEQKYFATTHFEPADARRVFPCVDDPSYKATFDISLKIDKNLNAVSNMLPASEKASGKNKKLIAFERSPLMSTYLLYLGVGEFEFKQSKYKDIAIRGVTTPGKIQYTEFALDCAKKFLSYFEDYFNFPYPLPKVDLIAVADFSAGAMENWGAITFRENALLFFPGRTSIVSKQRIAEVIAHELAHQWFGNLVTMKWWDDLWLNESFATFMAYKAINHYWPEWNIWTEYLTDTVFTGMSLDSLKSSHPIQVHVDNVSQVNELFDEIAYDKGGSILRMLEEYLSHDVFRDGLREYISKYKYGNAQGSDLWICLEKVSKKPVSKLMQSFITQTGFPSISINLSGATLSVRQERFSFEQNQQQEKWFVPLVIQDDKQVSRHLLEGKDHSFLMPRTPKFINVNFMYSGFYISTYSNQSLTMLGKNIDKLHDLDRIGILHDLYYAVLASRRTIVDLVDFIERFFNVEKDPTVLIYILRRLVSSYLFLEKEPLKHLISAFADRSLKIVNKQPQKDEDPNNVVLRNLALYAHSLFDHQATKTFVNEQFEMFLNDEASLHQDLRGTVYGLAVLGEDKNYSKVLELYRKTYVQEEKVKFLSALALTKNKELLKKTFDFSLSNEVSFANIIYIFSSAGRNPHSKSLLLDWLIENWDSLVASGGGVADMLLRHILKNIIPVSGIGRETEVKKFFNNMKNVTLGKTLEQVLEELEVYSRFVGRNKKLI